MAKTSKKPVYLKHTYVCMLAGGTGTRLWPRSRKKDPKQFTSLFKDHSLFQQTIKRLRGLIPLSKVYVTTNDQYVNTIRQQEPFLPEENIIGEPVKRDTAMAIGTIAALVYKKDPQGVIVNLATDHQITNLDLYHRTLKAAAKTAFENNVIAVIGIKPTFPHTGMGHIKRGKKITKTGSFPVFKVDSFKEKPNFRLAKRYTKSGKYYWNTNKFVFPAKLMLEEFKKYAPDIYQHLMRIYKAADTKNEARVIDREYLLARSVAIDYAIAEKTDRLVLIPGKFGWSDVGDWKIVYDLSEKDKQGNVVISHGRNGGGYYNLNSKNNLIQFDDELIVTIGVENLLIVDTKDALLICHKDQAQLVKKVVKDLEKKKDPHT